MTEATLAVTSPDEILTLFGARDQHLRTIRRLFDVSITHRQGQIRVTGEPEAVQQTTRVLEKLRHLSRRKGVLSPLDVQAIAAEEGVTGEGDQAIAVADVEIRHAKRKVQPRTKGQARYV